MQSIVLNRDSEIKTILVLYPLLFKLRQYVMRYVCNAVVVVKAA